MSRQPTIIKPPSLDLQRAGLRSFQLNDVLDEARATVVEAKRQAAEIVAQARRQSETILADARRQGHSQGHAEGRKEGAEVGRREAFEQARGEFGEQQRGLTTACERMLEQVNADRAEWLATARQDLVELAMAIANRVAHHVGQRDREVVLANLEEAVRIVGQRSELTIQVNPADASACRDFAPAIAEAQSRCEHVKVVENEQVSPGGCIVRWSSGEADATIETQLRRIETELGVESEGG